MPPTSGGDDAQQKARRWRALPYRWALRHAPVATSAERFVLSAYADHSDADGSGAYPGPSALMNITLLDETTIKRARRTLLARGLMVLGDQSRARRLPSGQRPRVLDLQVPYSWYAAQKGGAQALREMNAWRVEQGLEPLTPENRPDLAPAPPKKQRADKGLPRRAAETPDAEPDGEEGGAARPPFDDPGDQEEEEGGLQDPPRGGYKTPQGGSESPPTSSFNLACDPADDDCGDGRRPTPGSSEPSKSGSAAPDRMNTSSRKAKPADMRAVVQGIPGPLMQLLEQDWSEGLPSSVNKLIEEGLTRDLRTVGQLVDRMGRRWTTFGYEDALLSQDGEGIRKATGVLLELLSPSKCWGNNLNCEDGIDRNTDAPCPRCEEAREDRIRASEPEPARAAEPQHDRPTSEPPPLPAPREEAPEGQTYGVNAGLARQAREAVLANKGRLR